MLTMNSDDHGHCFLVAEISAVECSGCRFPDVNIQLQGFAIVPMGVQLGSSDLSILWILTLHTMGDWVLHYVR
jgi:hypothetical protein